MTDLDWQPQHPATIAGYRARYGTDMDDGSAITWEQNGWRWTAHRRDGHWHIVGINPHTSPSSARGHTWDQLCSRLDRMAAHDLERHPPHDPIPLVAPVQLGSTAPRRHTPLIPLSHFPNIGATA